MRYRQGGVGITARATTQECTRIVENGLSGPFRGICVHCCAVGLGCGWPWDRNSVHKWEDRASPRRIGAFVYTVGLLRCCGQTWGRRSVHRSAKMASPRRFGAFVYTVAMRVAIRIATRAAPGGTSASTTTACRRRPLAGPSRLVGKTGSARVAPLPGWHLRRGVNPHEPPKSISFSRIIRQEKPCSIGHGGIFLRLYMSHAWLGHVAPRPFDGLLVSGSR